MMTMVMFRPDRDAAFSLKQLINKFSIIQQIACHQMFSSYLLCAPSDSNTSGERFSDASRSHSDDNESTDGDETIKLKPRGRKRRKRDLEPKSNAPWQRMLDRAEQINGASDPDSIDGRYFRLRFRVSYSMFKALIQVMLDDNWFPGDFEADGSGKCSVLGIQGASLHVKVLPVLRALGRGVCFDELYDGSGLSEAVTSTFFFVLWQYLFKGMELYLNEQ
jgi:hypothetical protein